MWRAFATYDMKWTFSYGVRAFLERAFLRAAGAHSATYFGSCLCLLHLIPGFFLLFSGWKRKFSWATVKRCQLLACGRGSNTSFAVSSTSQHSLRLILRNSVQFYISINIAEIAPCAAFSLVAPSVRVHPTILCAINYNQQLRSLLTRKNVILISINYIFAGILKNFNFLRIFLIFWNLWSFLRKLEKKFFWKISLKSSVLLFNNKIICLKLRNSLKKTKIVFSWSLKIASRFSIEKCFQTGIFRFFLQIYNNN